MKLKFILLVFSTLLLTAALIVYIIRIIRRDMRVWREKQNLRNENIQKAVADMTPRAKSFIGLYEPLQMIKNSQLKSFQSVFADWDTRIGNMEDAPALVNYWNETYSGFDNWNNLKAVRKAGELLMFIQKAGITRCAETEVKVTRDIFRQYMAKGGVRIEPDTVAYVEMPCWMSGDEVLEKGIIKGGNQDE